MDCFQQPLGQPENCTLQPLPEIPEAPTVLLAADLLGLSALPALGQSAAPLKIIVGYPAGATSDSLTRVVAEHMAATLKQTVIVENKPGAGAASATSS